MTLTPHPPSPFLKKDLVHRPAVTRRAAHSRSTLAITWRPVPPAAVRIDSGWNCTPHRPAAVSSIAITAPSGVTAVTV